MRMAIPPGIKPDPRALAYHRFQYDFLMPGNRDANDTGLAQSVDDLFTFIPTLYQSAGENSAMVNIVNAIAYINFAHRYHVSDAETMAEQNFWKAIKALSRVVTNNKEAATNEALFAVYLMSVYEVGAATRIQLVSLNATGLDVQHSAAQGFSRCAPDGRYCIAASANSGAIL